MFIIYGSENLKKSTLRYKLSSCRYPFATNRYKVILPIYLTKLSESYNSTGGIRIWIEFIKDGTSKVVVMHHEDELRVVGL